MIDFGLSDEQEALQRAAREFLAGECPPSLVRETAKTPDGVPRALFRKIAEQGWLGLAVPEKFGGLGLHTLDLALVLEEAGRAALPGPFLATQLVIAALVHAGSTAQKKTWLPRLAAGEAFAALAYLEEGDRQDPAGVQVTAKRTRDGWQLAGTKLFVLDAPAADVLLVAARTKKGEGAAGVSLFLVERATPGVKVLPQETMDLTRRVGEVVLRNAVVPRDALVGTDGAGWPVLARLLDLACVGIAADSLGGAERALEMAVTYAMTREQFGRKIGSFQAMKHIAAEIVADVAPATSLVWWAAWMQDRGGKDAARAAAMAKASLGDVASRTTRRAVEMHGGIGFTWEHDLHLWFKRAHMSELLFGAPPFHRERLAVLAGW
ncbi:MAG: acyl-CoA dehydrogenase family protein [Candidatus Binatia bacterium]